MVAQIVLLVLGFVYLLGGVFADNPKTGSANCRSALFFFLLSLIVWVSNKI